MSKTRFLAFACGVLALSACSPASTVTHSGPELSYGTDDTRAIVGLTSEILPGVKRTGMGLALCLLSPGSVTVTGATAHAGSNVEIADVSARPHDDEKGIWLGPEYNPVPAKLGFKPLPATVSGECVGIGEPFGPKPYWELLFSVPHKAGTHLTGVDVHYTSNGEERTFFHPFIWDFCDAKTKKGCPEGFKTDP